MNDDEIDLQQEYRDGVQSAAIALFGEDMGRKVGDSLAKSVFNGFAGIDIHSRVGLQDIPFRTPQQEK